MEHNSKFNSNRIVNVTKTTFVFSEQYFRKLRKVRVFQNSDWFRRSTVDFQFNVFSKLQDQIVCKVLTKFRILDGSKRIFTLSFRISIKFFFLFQSVIVVSAVELCGSCQIVINYDGFIVALSLKFIYSNLYL